MKVMYWNVCNVANQQEIIDHTKELLGSGQIDIACLSEVPYETRHVNGKPLYIPLSEVIATDLDMDSTFEHTRTIRRSKRKLKGYGTAIISRSKILEKGTTVLRDDRLTYMTPGKGNQRVLMSVRTAQDPELEVNVAHLSYPMPIRKAIKGLRTERKRLSEALTDKLNKGRIIFGGDMNVRPGGRLDAILHGLGLKQLVDPLLHTFRSRHWYAGYTKRNLDRVFVSKDVSASAAVEDRRQSDHHPVIVTIQDSPTRIDQADAR